MMRDPTAAGHLEVITGCMFAGKTEELLHRLRRAEIAENDTAVFTPAIDDRYGTHQIGTHNGRTWEATVVDVDKAGMRVIKDEAAEADVVAIDEGNFFDGTLVETVQELADNGKRVIISGIDQTFRGTPFEPMHRVMAVADDVDKLSAVCEHCNGQATRNQRLIEGEPAPADAPTIQVAGEEAYEARCRQCHNVPSPEER